MRFNDCGSSPLNSAFRIGWYQWELGILQGDNNYADDFEFYCMSDGIT